MRSLPYDIDFRRRAKNVQGWGVGLLAVASVLWVWSGVLLLTPYSVGDDDDRDCEARLFTEYSTANEGSRNGSTCAAERDWPELLGVIGLSVPVSVVGAVLFTSGSVSNRMAEHLAEVTRLNEARV